MCPCVSVSQCVVVLLCVWGCVSVCVSVCECVWVCGWFGLGGHHDKLRALAWRCEDFNKSSGGPHRS